MEKRCPNCNNIMVERRINYQETVLGKRVTIPDVEGYFCRECGHTEPYKDVKERGLQTKLLEKELELRKEKPVIPLLINHIRRIRQTKRIPQKKIGEVLEFTEQRFGAIERNDNTPTIFLAIQLADILNVEIGEIYNLVYIPEALFNRIRDLDSSFKEIPGLKETREQYESLVDELERSKKLVNQLEKKNKDLKELEHLEKVLSDKSKDESFWKLNRRKKTIEKRLKKLEGLNSSPEKILELKGIIKELKAKKEILQKEFYNLEAKSILKQGYCIDVDSWEKLQKMFPELDQEKSTGC